MKNRNFLKSFLVVAFAFAVMLGTSTNIFAQRYLSELKSNNNVNGVAQFGENLANFLNLAEALERKRRLTQPEIAALEAAGKKVKDGSNSFRSNLKGLIAKIKADNRWNAEFDNEATDIVSSRKIAALFRGQGARKLLSEAETAANSLSADIDAIINSIKNDTAMNFDFDDENIFVKASFVNVGSKRKFSLRCALLGAAIFGAELLRAPKTAENLDKIFDSKCGGSGGGSVTPV